MRPAMSFFQPDATLNCRGRLVRLDRPFIMGVLNVTPDSFFDGGMYLDLEAAMQQVDRLLKDGADIIDVGGMSSRPGAQTITKEEELLRILPVIKEIKARHPEVLVSVDTVHADVAEAAVESGALLVNDISAGEMDPAMLATVAGLNVPYIAMHMKGLPANMQDDPQYDDVALEILDYFIGRVRACRQAGIKDIIVDPGLGFGKRVMHNYEILARLEIFQMLQLPIMIGASRKSMIYKMLDISVDEALNGTTAINMFALTKGVSLLRVHDVREARECLVIFEALVKSAEQANNSR
jgi:dihydropteroate synthase